MTQCSFGTWGLLLGGMPAGVEGGVSGLQDALDKPQRVLTASPLLSWLLCAPMPTHHYSHTLGSFFFFFN